VLVEVLDGQSNLSDVKTRLPVVEPVNFAEDAEALVAQIPTGAVVHQEEELRVGLERVRQARNEGARLKLLQDRALYLQALPVFWFAHHRLADHFQRKEFGVRLALHQHDRAEPSFPQTVNHRQVRHVHTRGGHQEGRGRVFAIRVDVIAVLVVVPPPRCFCHVHALLFGRRRLVFCQR